MKRLNLNWGDCLERAQRLTDGLTNKDPTGEYRSETSQPEDESSCNASGARGFRFGLLTAETHMSCCNKPVVAQVVPRFMRIKSLRALQIAFFPCNSPLRVPRNGFRVK